MYRQSAAVVSCLSSILQMSMSVGLGVTTVTESMPYVSTNPAVISVSANMVSKVME